jgi:hypothetical protein
VVWLLELLQLLDVLVLEILKVLMLFIVVRDVGNLEGVAVV